jgi:hypothetical protein
MMHSKVEHAAHLLCSTPVPTCDRSIAKLSLVAIVPIIPAVLGLAFIVEQVGRLNFLALATPALAYGGPALMQNDFQIAYTTEFCLRGTTFLHSSTRPRRINR